MTPFDVIGGIELTASAAVLVIVLSQALGASSKGRWTIAAALTAWFAIVVALAATGLLHAQRGIGSAGVGAAVIVPTILLWIAVSRIASLRQGAQNIPLWQLVALHSVRVLGVSFLILQAAQRLPSPFAPVAGGGDIIAGLAAMPVAWMIHRRAHGWPLALFAWNIFGLADLAAAIGLGVLSSPGPLRLIFNEPSTGLMSTLPWMLIPAYLVPLLAVIHLVIFRRLVELCHAQPSACFPVAGRGELQWPGSNNPRTFTSSAVH
jgi:hypothetical protein